jgi:hypothetical protein
MKISIVLQTPIKPDPAYNYISPNDIVKIENYSCEEVLLEGTLDTIKDRNSFLLMCMEKLGSKGMLSIVGIDIVEISKYILSGQITIDEANTIIYGNRQSLDSIFKLITFLGTQGYTITDKRMLNYSYLVKANKP